MKNLRRPHASYRRDLTSVLTFAEQGIYGPEIEAACNQAQSYARKTPQLGSLSSVLTSNSSKSFFRSLYDANRMAVIRICVRVRAKLDNHTRAKCQYCGLAPPRTLDHYLEKARLPELSIYARNLVPCCDHCNNIKHTFAPSGERQILHLYDDDVDALPELMVVTFRFSNGAPVAEFEVEPSTDPLRDLYRRHFYALRLNERYSEEASSNLRVFKRRAVNEHLDVAATVDSLRSHANALRSEHGPNQFEAALYEAASGDEQVLQWMTQP